MHQVTSLHRSEEFGSIRKVLIVILFHVKLRIVSPTILNWGKPHYGNHFSHHTFLRNACRWLIVVKNADDCGKTCRFFVKDYR